MSINIIAIFLLKASIKSFTVVSTLLHDHGQSWRQIHSWIILICIVASFKLRENYDSRVLNSWTTDWKHRVQSILDSCMYNCKVNVSVVGTGNRSYAAEDDITYADFTALHAMQGGISHELPVPSLSVKCLSCNTRSSATVKSTARPSCLVGVLYDIYRETNNRSTANQPLVRNWPWNLPNSAK